jgi:protoporphyrinogen IX oxidase
MTPHEALKTLHIVSMAVWIGGMFTMAMAAVVLASDRSGIERVRAAIAPLASLSMMSTLVLGFGLAYSAGWLSERWVVGKMLTALVLAGFHGYVSGQVRRMARDPSRPLSAMMRASPIVLLLSLLTVVALAVRKP